MQHPRIRVSFIILMLVGSTACNPTSTDVTADIRYQGGYKAGREYEILEDVFILHGGELFEPGVDTGRSNASGEVMTPSLLEFQRAGEKWPNIDGLLPKGAKIRLTKFELYSFTEDTVLHIHAQPLDGKFKGSDLQIQNLSLAVGNTLALTPNPQYLKEVGTSAAGNLP